MRNKCLIIAGTAIALGMANAAEAARWYVDQNTPAPPSQQNGQTWETAFPDLQVLFNLPGFQTDPTNREVWVANGRYEPTLEHREPGESQDGRTVTYVIPSGVEIYGGFHGYISPSDPGEVFRFERNPEVNLTTLSGDIGENDVEAAFPYGGTYTDNAYHVVTIPEAFVDDGPTRVSGFIIRGGYADNTSYTHNFGGGVKSILVEGTPGPQVGNVQFNRLLLTYNYAQGRGGGMYIDVKDRIYRLANCRFEQNYADGEGGGGFYSESTIVDLMNCIFWKNYAINSRGGGAYISGGSFVSSTRDVIN